MENWEEKYRAAEKNWAVKFSEISAACWDWEKEKHEEMARAEVAEAEAARQAVARLAAESLVNSLRGELAEAKAALMVAATEKAHGHAELSECGHNRYWIGHFGGCMACGKEKAEKERDEARAEVERMGQYIRKKGLDQIDHACVQCVPHGEIVIDGFLCAYHYALALTPAKPCDECGGHGYTIVATRRSDQKQGPKPCPKCAPPSPDEKPEQEK